MTHFQSIIFGLLILALLGLIGMIWRLHNTKKQIKNLEHQIQNAKDLSTLTGGITHDFNNILGAILGFSYILEEDLIRDPHLKEIASQITLATKRGQEIVLQLMRYGRQNISDDGHTKRLASLDNIILETIDLVRPSLKKSTKIQYQNDTTDDTILCDPIQISQIILNLCINADHAISIQTGLIQITLQHTNIKDHFQHKDMHITNDPHNKNGTIILNGAIKNGAYLCLSIQDNGQGMTRDVASKIFDPFFTTKDIQEGTGLGLTAIHGIVHGHDGAIKLTTTPFKGSRFYIYLPVIQ